MRTIAAVEFGGRSEDALMKLVVTEKNDAAEKIASLLSSGSPKKDKVFNTPVYRFEVDGEEWVTIGLRGHILEPDFAPQLIYRKRGGWMGIAADGTSFRQRFHRLCQSPRSRRRSRLRKTEWI